MGSMPTVSCDECAIAPQKWQAGDRIQNLHFKGKPGHFAGTVSKDGQMVITVSRENFSKWGIDPNLQGETAAVVLSKPDQNKNMNVKGAFVGNSINSHPTNPNGERFFIPDSFQYADGHSVQLQKLQANDPSKPVLEDHYYMNTRTWNLAAPQDLPKKSHYNSTDQLGENTSKLEHIHEEALKKLAAEHAPAINAASKAVTGVTTGTNATLPKLPPGKPNQRH